MRTRRGESLGGNIQPPSAMLSGVNPSSQEPTAIPTQQQRLLAQLRTAMLNLNKKFGNNVTTEVLNQMVGSLIFDQEELKYQSWRPEYSDVKIDIELSNPPVPEGDEGVATAPARGAVAPLPSWFDYEKISDLENAHFGPLFSMDDERWKMYISMRNDLIRIYEDHVIVNGGEFMSANEIRQRMHPKDDAAQIFELWKFLSQHKVINRGQLSKDQNDALTGTVRDSVQAIGSQDVKNSSPATNYNPVKCCNCSRECKFFCYKSVPPPPQSPEPTTGDDLGVVETPDIPMPSDDTMDDPEGVKDDVEMKEEKESDEKFFCHDCTPPYFEKIPLRLFIDEVMRDRIAHGEFEEVTKDDLRSFIVVPTEREDSGMIERRMKNEKILAEKQIVDKLMASILVGGNKHKGVVANWDSYKSTLAAVVKTESLSTKNAGEQIGGQNNNPLEILDPLLQEALSGAGQKIRGSVLIEQQVRNLIIGTHEISEEQVPTCHPVSVNRAFELITEIFTLVHDTFKDPLPREIVESEIFVHAKKTDHYHFGILSLIYRIIVACESIKNRSLRSGGVDLKKLEKEIVKRISIKREFVSFLKQHNQSSSSASVSPSSPRASAKVEGFRGQSIFQSEVTPAVLSSKNPAQLKLVAL